jgi:hypothetical protein
MLSSEERAAIYGSEEQQAAEEEAMETGEAGGVEPSASASLVEMPAVDDISATELNPQSLAFEEISVGSPAPPPYSNKPDATGSARVAESKSSPYLPDDSATKPIRAGGPSQGVLGGGGPSQLDAAEQSANANLWQLAYYKPLFDVDSHHILTRTIHALLPRPRAQFFEVIAANPDLYGPFWISTTLVFVIGVSGNLAKWLQFKPTEKQAQWMYDFTKLSGASTAVYFYAAAAPVAVWAALRYIQANKRLVDVVCIYGYSLATYVPISLLCVLPSGLIRWLLIALGCAASSAFLLSNVYTHLQDCFPYSDSDSMKRGYAVLAAMGVSHAIFALILKVCFF